MPLWCLEHFGALEHWSIFGAFEHFGALEHWSAFGARALEHFRSVGSLDRFGSIGVYCVGVQEHFWSIFEHLSAGALVECWSRSWSIFGEFVEKWTGELSRIRVGLLCVESSTTVAQDFENSTRLEAISG